MDSPDGPATPERPTPPSPSPGTRSANTHVSGRVFAAPGEAGGGTAAAPAGSTPSWPAVVLILGLTLGLTGIGCGFAGVLIAGHSVDARTAVWAVAAIVGTVNPVALSLFVVGAARRGLLRKMRTALTYLVGPADIENR